ncbi:Uncharacterised protein [Mycobacteroides abscessus subsp. abscessus]|nr:Uncharacterised protein [Mycobacteroides abscessus subsp. abscessus]
MLCTWVYCDVLAFNIGTDEVFIILNITDIFLCFYIGIVIMVMRNNKVGRRFGVPPAFDFLPCVLRIE